MKALIPGLFMALVVHFSVAQKSPVKFGEIPMEDMKMTVYDKDSSAAAVILVDYGEAYIALTSINVSLNFERHVRIKILKKEGLRWADAEIPLWKQGSTEESATNLKAVTYNLENGKIVETKMSKDGIFKEKFNKNVVLQKFTLPNVKEGSVLEYSYTLRSDFLTSFPNWQFQYKIPVRWSEYWAMFPEFFFFEKYMQGYVPVTSYEIKNKNQGDFQAQAHHWVCKNVPAFKEEPFMTSENDYVSKINFALSHINFPGQPVREVMGSWKKLNDELVDAEGFGKVISGSGFLKKKAEELVVGVTDPQEKLTRIYDYVKSTLEWNGTSDKYPESLKNVLDEKKGTAADINFMLASMLEKVDIPVDMVLLSTRDHGFIREQYPMEKQLNYVICAAQINGKMMLLDATDKYLPMHVLPERCLNGRGLVVSKTRHGWIAIENKTKAKTTINADFVLSSDGELKGKLSYAFDGYDAHKLRKSYNAKGEADYLKDFTSEHHWNIEKSTFENIKEIGEIPKQVCDVTIAEHTTVAGDLIYINPFVTDQIKENEFKLEKREYPVDFGKPQEKIYLAKIVVPEGFSVDELPKPRVMVLPGNAAKYTYNITANGNTLSAVSILVINKSMFVQEEYRDLREFYNQMVAKQAEQIVLKKN
ncbi:MAG TPA: transglutaminase domain-containing protein [Ohtaekwangia sp.]|nr:transglutaminase domain-containing protein [Ohtaekwangia sp.]